MNQNLDQEDSQGYNPGRGRAPRWRKQYRHALRIAGLYKPRLRRQWIWSVEPQAIRVPAWAQRNAVRGMGLLKTRVWLWQVDARKLIAQDAARGGKSRILITELRHCSLCMRPCIGLEAEERRKLDAAGLKTPCGERCERDRSLRIWERLIEQVAA